MIVTTDLFVAKKKEAAKLPLLVYGRGGVLANVNPGEDAHVSKELVEQGYVAIAPDYRGSTGYGAEYWKLIDYGGLYVEDVLAAKRWAVENRSEIDSRRVGILGWSHGGMITLLNIFRHPEDFAVAYAGVPVTDLVSRMGYKRAGSPRAVLSALSHRKNR